VIPVKPKSEPADFSRKVRKPGLAFLQKDPQPKNWKNREYWREILYDLHKSYNGICAYSAQWIPYDQDAATVDHFLPKSSYPQFAYEWSNYRLASRRMNSRKREYLDVLDPFTLAPDWLILHFPSLQIKSNPALQTHQRKQVTATIDRLMLNDEICIESRKYWLRAFCGGCPFNFLERNAPFVSYELKRQDLVEKIASIMQF
jgi:uncharacterized protein (TIGR02646 family)